MNMRSVAKKAMWAIPAVLSFTIGVSLAHAADVWEGRWKNPDKVPYINNVSGNSTLKSLVNDAALDNWNNNQDVVTFKKITDTTVRHIYVKNVDLSSVTWSGIAEGASYNWDSNGYYKGVEIKINEHYTDDYDKSTIRGVIAHEFGHAVGLQHQSSSKQYLMYPSDARTTEIISTKEEKILKEHYAD